MQMKIITPFEKINKNNEVINKYFLENNFKMEFPLVKKLYYSVFRPILPLPIRKILQKKYNEQVKCNGSFINHELVDIITTNTENKEILSRLYPDQNQTAVILTHDVETQAGYNFIPKVIELEKSLGLKSSWNIVPYKYTLHQEIIDLIHESEDELGIHGYNHDGKLYYSEKIFNERLPYINEAIEKYNCVGFRSPSVHRNIEWLQKLNIKYDASFFDYDPYQPFPGGTGSIWPYIAGKFVELPYTLPQDHTIFYVLQQKDISIWKNKIDWLIKNNGMILIITHPDYLIEEQNFNLYRQLLEYLKNIPQAWHCLPYEMSDWWEKLVLNHNSI